MTQLTRFKCKHVGAMIKGKNIQAFIRWAEVRSNPVTEETQKNCPDCGAG
jgi:hypothetical protein